MPIPEAPLAETRGHCCPSCHGQRIAPMGRVVVIAELVKEKRWCEACGTAFWLVRTVIAGPG